RARAAVGPLERRRRDRANNASFRRETQECRGVGPRKSHSRNSDQGWPIGAASGLHTSVRVDGDPPESYALLVIRHAPGRDPKGLRYRHAPSPIHFPAEAEVPESRRHLILRTYLLLVAQHEYQGRHSLGCDQFVYWNASDPRRNVAPDLF